MSLDVDLDSFHDHLSGADDADSQDMDMNLRHNGQNQAEKRAHHNALERKRRDHIKGSFSDLRDVIPSLNGEKVRVTPIVSSPLFSVRFSQASRAHVLKAATDFIRTIKSKNQQHQQAIEELKKQNASCELQSTRPAGRSESTFVSSPSSSSRTRKGNGPIYAARSHSSRCHDQSRVRTERHPNHTQSIEQRKQSIISLVISHRFVLSLCYWSDNILFFFFFCGSFLWTSFRAHFARFEYERYSRTNKRRV